MDAPAKQGELFWIKADSLTRKNWNVQPVLLLEDVSSDQIAQNSSVLVRCLHGNPNYISGGDMGVNLEYARRRSEVTVRVHKLVPSKQETQES